MSCSLKKLDSFSSVFQFLKLFSKNLLVPGSVTSASKIAPRISTEKAARRSVNAARIRAVIPRPAHAFLASLGTKGKIVKKVS